VHQELLKCRIIKKVLERKSSP